MSEIHVVALITAAEGKEARVKELLLDLGNKVKQHETDVVCTPPTFPKLPLTTLAQIRNLRAIQRPRTKCLRRRRNLCVSTQLSPLSIPIQRLENKAVR